MYVDTPQYLAYVQEKIKWLVQQSTVVQVTDMHAQMCSIIFTVSFLSPSRALSTKQKKGRGRDADGEWIRNSNDFYLIFSVWPLNIFCRFNLNCHLKTNSVIYNLSYLMTQIRGTDYKNSWKSAMTKGSTLMIKKKGQTNWCIN